MKKALIICMMFVLVIITNGCNTMTDIEVYNEMESIELPVLMYHSVDENVISMYTETPEKLESDIVGLKNAGYTPVSFDEVIDYVYNDGTLPEKPVVITFDDGYENNCTILLPMAERIGFKYEVFTVAGFIHYGKEAMEWYEVEMVNESEYGNIGTHTFNMHVNPDRFGVVRNEGEDFRTWEHLFRYDITMAKKLFIENIGENPVTFAYPYGSFSAEAERILHEEGYKLTVTTEPGINRIEKSNPESLYLLKRISMDGQAYSATDMIESCRNMGESSKIEITKKEVASWAYVSRQAALEALYGERLKDADYNLESVAPYIDLEHAGEEAKAIFAKCIENGIISGFPDYTMRPTHYITRGEFAILLAQSSGYDMKDVKITFSDSEGWNAPALSWCAEKGYMKGYGEAFGVNDFLTQEQIDVILERVGKSE